MTPPPTILLLSDAAGMAGAERVLTTVADCGSSAGLARFVGVCPTENTDLASALARSGCVVEAVDGLDRSLRASTVYRILRLVRSHQPSGVVVNLTDQGDGKSLLSAMRLWSGSSVAVVHLWVPGAPRWRYPVYRALLGGVTRLVSPGQGTVEDLERIGVRASVIPNGLIPVELSERTDARAQLGLGSDDVVVGGIGRLTEQKGWDVLAEAWPEVIHRLPGTKAVLIGDGPLRPVLEGRGITLPGEIQEASRLLKAFDLLVVPSRFEAHALTPIEGAMAGIPVVLSDVEGVRGSVMPGSELVRPDDPASLAAGIIEVLSDLPARKQLAWSATSSAVANHDPAPMVRQLLHASQGKRDSFT
jgi:glycosyltransferase involved in cell wall biosynthesis